MGSTRIEGYLCQSWSRLRSAIEKVGEVLVKALYWDRRGGYGFVELDEPLIFGGKEKAYDGNGYWVEKRWQGYGGESHLGGGNWIFCSHVMVIRRRKFYVYLFPSTGWQLLRDCEVVC